MDASSSLPFTASRDPHAESRIGDDLAAIAEDVARGVGAPLRALLLVGSYARAEGGVMLRNGAPSPLNDYDLVAVCDRVDRATKEALRAVEHAWTKRAGVAVDVWPTSPKLVASPPPTLFWLDVALGGVRVLHGATPIGALKARDVPLEEAARLLSNRAVGLALSRLDREGARPHVDRATIEEEQVRHVLKSVLACGDALLLAADRYAPTVSERADRLEQLAGAPAVPASFAAAYRAASIARARPDRFAPENGLAAWVDASTKTIADAHLAFEHRRIGAPLDPYGYASFGLKVFDDLRDARFGGLGGAISARIKGDAPLFPFVGHPRERLARVAVALAYGDDRARAHALRLLGMPGASSPSAIRERLVRLATRGG